MSISVLFAATHKWPGGTCPVPDDVLVIVSFRDGSRELCVACDVDWANHGMPTDVVEFRVPEIQKHCVDRKGAVDKTDPGRKWGQWRNNEGAGHPLPDGYLVRCRMSDGKLTTGHSGSLNWSLEHRPFVKVWRVTKRAEQVLRLPVTEAV